MQIYQVGGSVRDQLLGKIPSDFDYVVVGSNAQHFLNQGYEQVGADFPVFLHPVTGDEYALARVERKISDGHQGFTVETENVSLKEDLFRRDISINAIAKDVNGNIIDPYNGINDLKDKILRHVSPAFSEDPLRVVRIARFLAKFPDFTVAPTTRQLCVQMVRDGALNYLSQERVWLEIEKTMKCENPKRFFDFLRSIYAFDYVPGLTCFQSLTDQKINNALHSNEFEIQLGLLLQDAKIEVSKGLNSRSLKIKQIAEMDWTDLNSTSILNRLQKSGSLQHNWNDTFTVIRLVYPNFTLANGLSRWHAMQVKSDQGDLAWFSGVELGNKIREERIKRIKNVIGCH